MERLDTNVIVGDLLLCYRCALHKKYEDSFNLRGDGDRLCFDVPNCTGVGFHLWILM